jgi:hypothetical protein
MKTYVVERDGTLPLRFSGEMIGFAEDDRSILALYRTQAGQYVCEKIALPTARSPNEKRKANVSKTRRKIKEFFGASALAGALYTMAHVDHLPQEEAFEDIP